jgi:hypothetical protein
MATGWNKVASMATDAAKTGIEKAKEKLDDQDLAAFLKLPDDQPIRIEKLLVLLVSAVHSDSPRELSKRDVKRAGKRRHRVVGGFGMLGGPAGIYAASLLSEAQIVCDVADRHALDLTNDELAAHLLVLWNAMPDHASALAAIDRSGPSVASHLALRSRGRLVEIPPTEMTKRQAVQTLWRARGVAKDVTLPGSARPKDVLLPGGRVKTVINAAERQFGVDDNRRRLLGARG